MLMIDHFVERETKLLEISKRGEEKYLNSNVRRISRRLFCDKPLTIRSPCRIALFTALALGSRAVNTIQHRERVVTSTYTNISTIGYWYYLNFLGDFSLLHVVWGYCCHGNSCY